MAFVNRRQKLFVHKGLRRYLVILFRCYSNPVSGVNGRAATAKRIKHNVAGLAREAQNPLQKSHGLLRRIAEPFLGLTVERRNICPDIAERSSALLVKVTL